MSLEYTIYFLNWHITRASGEKTSPFLKNEVSPDIWSTLVEEKIFSKLQQTKHVSKIPSFNNLMNMKMPNSYTRKYIVDRTVARITGAVAARLFGLTIITSNDDFEKREKVALEKIAEIILGIGNRNSEKPFSLRIDYNGNKPTSVENCLMYWPEVTKILLESFDPFVEEFFGININSEDRDNLALGRFDRLQEQTKKYFIIFLGVQHTSYTIRLTIQILMKNVYIRSQNLKLLSSS